MDMPHGLPPATSADIQEYDVGLVRLQEGNITEFRAYVRALNPDQALMHVRMRLPESIADQFYFKVKPWVVSIGDAATDLLKQHIGLDTLLERVTAPAPIFMDRGKSVARVGDLVTVAGPPHVQQDAPVGHLPGCLVSHVESWDCVPDCPKAEPSTETADTIALLEKFRERCAKEGDYEVEMAAKNPNRDDYYARVVAKHIRQIDVSDWVLKETFMPSAEAPQPYRVEPPRDPFNMMSQEIDHWTNTILTGLGVPREYIEKGSTLKPAFVIAVDQTGLCVRIVMNGKPIGIVQSIMLKAELSDENPHGVMRGRISFFSYPGMPTNIKQDRQMLRTLPWLTVDELELGPVPVQG
jgi:hypothetical protein